MQHTVPQPLLVQCLAQQLTLITGDPMTDSPSLGNLLLQPISLSLSTSKTTPIPKKERKKESEVTQSCMTLCNPMDCSLPGSFIHGIFQARVLEWVPFPSPGDLPNSGIKPRSPTLQAIALPSEPPGKPPVL